jgi:predicted RNA-binding protein with PUA-like domain
MSRAAPVGHGYWLFKSEPSTFSIDDLARSPRQTAVWDGVRNYQARNYLRDNVKVGDRVLFYHSREQPLGIFGTMTVVRGAYPDPTQFDPHSPYFDSSSSPDQPRWVAVDVQLLQRFGVPVTRRQLQEHPATAEMLVLRRGMRLSILPVSEREWTAVHKLAGLAP